MSYFHPYVNFNYLYLKIGLCDLFRVLMLECITYIMHMFMLLCGKCMAIETENWGGTITHSP